MDYHRFKQATESTNDYSRIAGASIDPGDIPRAKSIKNFFFFFSLFFPFRAPYNHPLASPPMLDVRSEATPISQRWLLCLLHIRLVEVIACCEGNLQSNVKDAAS